MGYIWKWGKCIMYINVNIFIKITFDKYFEIVLKS